LSYSSILSCVLLPYSSILSCVLLPYSSILSCVLLPYSSILSCVVLSYFSIVMFLLSGFSLWIFVVRVVNRSFFLRKLVLDTLCCLFTF